MSAPETSLKRLNGTSLVVQWLRLCASNAGDMSSIPGWELRYHMLYSEAKHFFN